MSDLEWTKVYNEWFSGPLTGPEDLPAAAMKKWFFKNSSYDEYLRKEFQKLVEQAILGQLDHWQQSSRGTLSLILLLDQFTRNIFRGEPGAFAGDERARNISKSFIEEHSFSELYPIERVFVYLPFEHSELLEDQKKAVELMAENLEIAPKKHESVFKDFLKYAESHREVIEKFGRFPHRNSILQRENTPAEQRYLETPGAGF